MPSFRSVTILLIASFPSENALDMSFHISMTIGSPTSRYFASLNGFTITLVVVLPSLSSALVPSLCAFSVSPQNACHNFCMSSIVITIRSLMATNVSPINLIEPIIPSYPSYADGSNTVRNTCPKIVVLSVNSTNEPISSPIFLPTSKPPKIVPIIANPLKASTSPPDI